MQCNDILFFRLAIMNCSFDKLWCETCMTYVVVTDSGARYNNGVSGTQNHSDKWIEGKLPYLMIFQNSIVPLARNEVKICVQLLP